jgi:thiol-disulfide isomerase/thioredoxin
VARIRAVLTLGATLILLSAGAPAPLVAQRDAAAYDQDIQKGETALRRAEFQSALDAFKRAFAAQPTAEALFGIARAYDGLDSHKLAVDLCTEALTKINGDARLEAEIRNLRGASLMALALGPDDKRLKDAEADLRAAAPSIVIARFHLGVTLLKQKRDAEGIQELRKYLEDAGDTIDGDVRRMIENPRRAREAYTPDFTLKTVDGKRLALADLKDKIVILDFWGSWCQPCVKALPGLIKLARKLDQRAVLISIDEGESEAAWRSYLAKNNTSWAQCWDNGRYAQTLNVKEFPTYIVIDGEGFVLARRSGYDARRTDAWLENEITKALTVLGSAR